MHMRRVIPWLFPVALVSCAHGLDTYFLEYEMDASLRERPRKALVLPPKGYLRYSELPRYVYWELALECAEELRASKYLVPLSVDTCELAEDLRERVPTYETYVDAGSLKGLAELYGAEAVVVPEVLRIAMGHRGNDPSEPTYYETTLLLRVYGYPERKLLYKAKARGEAWEDVGESVRKALGTALGPLLK